MINDNQTNLEIKIIRAIAARRGHIELAKHTSLNNYNFEKLEGKNPSPDLSFLYLNLLHEHKNIFNKRSKELNDFRDKRVKGLISIIADNEFWDNVYTPIVKDIDILNKKNDFIINTSYISKKNCEREKSIIFRLIYFIYGGNPYSYEILGIKKSEDEIVVLQKIKKAILFETAILNNKIRDALLYIGYVGKSNNFFSSSKFEEINKYLLYVSELLTECFSLLDSLCKLYSGNELMFDEDIINLWGGSKKAFYNERINEKSVLHRVSHENFGYGIDDTKIWLSKRNAIGSNSFIFEERISNIKYEAVFYDKFGAVYNSIDKAPNTALEEKSDNWLNFKDKTNPLIKIIGIGGAGTNIINYPYQHKYSYEFLSVLTHAHQDEPIIFKDNIDKLIIGNVIKEAGSGSNPIVGRRAALQSAEEIKKSLINVDMLFLVAGLGSGTGNGALPIIASIARDLGILTLCIATTPFKFEGNKRQLLANKAIQELITNSHSIFCVDNNFATQNTNKMTINDAMNKLDFQIHEYISSITQAVLEPSLINIDLEDLKIVFREAGLSTVINVKSSEKYRSKDICLKIEKEISVSNLNIKKAKAMLIKVSSANQSLDEYNEIFDYCQNLLEDTSSTLISCIHQDDGLKDELNISLIITGIPNSYNKPTPDPNLENLEDINENKPNESAYLDVPTFLRKQVD